jgi:hypothetical protein
VRGRMQTYRAKLMAHQKRDNCRIWERTEGAKSYGHVGLWTRREGLLGGLESVVSAEMEVMRTADQYLHHRWTVFEVKAGALAKRCWLTALGVVQD